jgi:hypothetical protein
MRNKLKTAETKHNNYATKMTAKILAQDMNTDSESQVTILNSVFRKFESNEKEKDRELSRLGKLYGIVTTKTTELNDEIDSYVWQNRAYEEDIKSLESKVKASNNKNNGKS